MARVGLGRKAGIRVLSTFCNLSDSLRVMMVREVLESGGLGEKEWEILTKKSESMKKDIEAIRKLTWIMERNAAR